MRRGVFRLSLPYYRSIVLRQRSVFDHCGNVIADTIMGGGRYDSETGGEIVDLKPGGDGHVWFPNYEKVLELIITSEMRGCQEINFYQYYSFSGVPKFGRFLMMICSL